MKHEEINLLAEYAKFVKSRRKMRWIVNIEEREVHMRRSLVEVNDGGEKFYANLSLFAKPFVLYSICACNQKRR